MSSLRLPVEIKEKYITTGNEFQIRYINEKEVSRITGRALSTLRNERASGRGIPYLKIGRSVRYSLADIICFMEGRRVETNQT